MTLIVRDPDLHLIFVKDSFTVNPFEGELNMPNEIRDPHDPVIPGEFVHPPEGHGGVSMPIGVSGDRTDPHDPVAPMGMGAAGLAHVEDPPPVEAPPTPTAADLAMVEAAKESAAAPLDEQLAETPKDKTGE